MCGWLSRESRAMYAVPPFLCEASMTLMLPAGSFGGVTSVQVLPSSRVRWTRPVLAPAQIRPAVTVEGAIDVIEPPGAGAPTPPTCPAGDGATPPLGAVRSGLIRCHVKPRSLEASTYCAAMYNVCGSCGENASGGAPPKRSSAVG